jgi:glycogen debranching enzyme
MTIEDKKLLFEQGYANAIELLSECRTSNGFLASRQDRDNYKRIWSRDGAIITLAALMSGEKKLIDCGVKTLLILADHQGPHGEIPSNIDPQTKRVSYGGTTGRVDSNLWFIIAAAEYWQRTNDWDFLRQIHKALEKACFLLGAWEYNNRDLLYVPLAGDWADEYVHNGYVLYDQLLYLQALRSLCAIHAVRHGSEDHNLLQKVSRLKHLIQANYWLN